MKKMDSEIKKYAIIVIMISVSYLIISNLKDIFNIFNKILDVLMPFILGGVIAFVLNIPMVKIEKLLSKKIKRKRLLRIISIILSLLIFIIIIAFISFLLIPELIENIKILINTSPTLINDIETWIIELLNKYPNVQIKLEEIFAQNGNIKTNILNSFANGAVGFISELINKIITIFTAIIFSIYILSQKEYLSRGTKKLMYAYLRKEHVNKLLEISKTVNKTFSKFISGQCLDAIILGFLIFIFLNIFRLPYALIISVLTAITALIPIFGAMIAMVVGVILIAMTNPIKAVIFAIVFLVVQQIEGNFIYPKVVGASVGLSPMWTLFAVIVGGNLFGVVGMLIGLPLASIVYAIIKNITHSKLREKDITVL